MSGQICKVTCFPFSELVGFFRDHLMNVDLLCWNWVAFHHCGMRLRPAVGRTYYILHLFSLLPSSSSFPLSLWLPLPHFFLHYFSFRLSEVVGMQAKWHMNLFSISMECRGTRCNWDTILPLLPCQRVKWLRSQQRCINSGQRELLTQTPAHSCGSVSTFACDPLQSFWKKPICALSTALACRMWQHLTLHIKPLPGLAFWTITRFGVCQLLRRWFLDDLWPRWWCDVSCVATRPTSGPLSSTHNVLNSHDLLCSCVKGQVQQIGFWYRTVILPTFHGSAQSTVILVNLDCYYLNRLSAYTVNSHCRCTSNACIYNGSDLVLLWLITWLLFNVFKRK